MIPICNLHSHTTFCDGANTPEEMVQAAIASNLCSLGFSAHSSLILPKQNTDFSLRKAHEEAYRSEILRLKQVYGDQIEVLLGLELDYFSALPEAKYDYLIGSVHYVCKDGSYIPMDLKVAQLKEGIQTLYGGNANAMAKDYFALVADVYQKTRCQIVGHFDLLNKWDEKDPCFDLNDPVFRSAALEAADALLQEDVLFEINTGAMSRGWRTLPYPAEFILKYLAQKNAKLILTGDSHSADAICFGYEVALDYAKACGVKELYVYRNGGFEGCLLS